MKAKRKEVTHLDMAKDAMSTTPPNIATAIAYALVDMADSLHDIVEQLKTLGYQLPGAGRGY